MTTARPSSPHPRAMTSPGRTDEAAAGDMLAAALDYALAGLPVLPLDGKVPRNHGGLTNASTDPAVISEWWRRWPEANIGIRTGTESGLFVLDVDVQHGGAGTLAELERSHGKLPRPHVLTGGGGHHYLFAHPGSEVRNSAGLLGPGLDTRGDGGYIVAPPSVHASGRPYKQLRPFADLDQVPAWLLENTAARLNGGPAEPVAEIIPQGRRRDALLSLAGSMRRRGMNAPEILAALNVVNETRCRPPLARAELEQLADDVGRRYQPDPAAAIPTAPATADAQPLADVVATFARWLHQPDPAPLYAVLAGVAANLLDGDPLWLLLVGPSGGGKTELLAAVTGLADVYPAATLTEAALLSGTPRKEHAQGASGGLLREVGNFGVLVLKDFGSVLSQHRDTRSAVLAALRELFDGSWTRRLGTDGGKTLHWEGKLGLLAGCTPAIDQHHGVLSALGERFVWFRLAVDNPAEQARRSLAHAGRERQMRDELAAAVRGLFAGLDLATPPPLSDDDADRLIALATLTVRCRSAVLRDSYAAREIELVPDSEAPGRLVAVLGRLLVALRLIGVPETDAWRVTVKAGLDSMPALRWRALAHLLAASTPRRRAPSPPPATYPPPPPGACSKTSQRTASSSATPPAKGRPTPGNPQAGRASSTDTRPCPKCRIGPL